MKIKVDTKENWCLYKDVNLGVAAKTELTQCNAAMCQTVRLRETSTSYGLRPISVRNECKNSVGSVDEHNFAGLVESLYKSWNILASVADMAKMQYSSL